MISVESRDERKRVGEMEDTELEEGEACYYQNGGGDPTIDPDVALSYIGDKLQDVLGHLQKDFEGGVSAENLGAKFGGYGSFLPTYQRSPAWSQQRTQADVYDYNTQRSPNNMDLEASRHNLFASSGSTPAMRPGSSSIAAMMTHQSHTPSVNGQVKRDACFPFTRAEESTFKDELQQNSENSCDQKTLRVRIKVGSDNLPARKNAEIYSGLGLDVSPSSSSSSSSSEDSSSVSEGFSRDIRDALDESPTSILKIVTSFLLNGERLLSPLSDDFIRFTPKEKYWNESVSKPLHKTRMNGYDSRKSNQKPLSEKKPNANEKNDFLESTNGNACVLLKKETDIDSLACEELVSNALKLPLLSNMPASPSGSVKGTATSVNLPMAAHEGLVKDRSSYDMVEEEPLEPESVQGVGEVQMPNENIDLSGRISQNKKANYVDNCVGYPKKQGRHKGQRTDDSVISLKGDRTHGSPNVEVLKDVAANESLLHKRNKNSRANSLLSKSDSEDTKNDHTKIKSKYQELFGDLELEQEDNEVASKEISSTEKPKDSELVQKKSMSECNGMTKENCNGRKSTNPRKAEEYPRVSSNGKVPCPVSGPRSDAAPLVKEDWVQCDKCQTWRLLPLGTNPYSLPKEWVCSMLYWLPSMNRCTVSEEETTQALRASYQSTAPGQALASPPESQGRQHCHPSKTLSGVSSAGAFDSTHDHQMLGQEASFNGEKKRYKSKDIPNRSKGVKPTESPNSVKKDLKVSSKNRSSNCVNHPSVNEYEQSSSSLGGKHANKQTQKKSSLDNDPAGGDPKNLKMRNKGQSDIDDSRASKKVKTEDALYNDKNCLSDLGRHLLKAEDNLSSKSKSSAPRKDQNKSNSHSKDLKESKSSVKKRKGYGTQDTRPSTGHHSQESCENGQRKEKKARTSMPRIKGINTSNVSIDKRAETMDLRMGQDRGSSLYQQSLDAADLKKETGFVHPPVVATSSSSKVSGSSKNKPNSQELKGSPVESVSSSPLRVSGTEKFASTLRNTSKDDMRDDCFLGTSSPRRFSDGENDRGGDRSGKLRRDVIPEVNHHVSSESSMGDLQDKDFLSGGTIKEENKSSPDFATHQAGIDADSQGDQYACKTRVPKQYEDDERRKEDPCHNSGSNLKKLENGSSSRPKDINRGPRPEYGNVHIKVSDSMHGSLDNTQSFDENLKDGQSKFQEKPCVSSVKVENGFISEKVSSGKPLYEITKCETQSNSSDGKIHEITKQDSKQNVVLETDVEKASKKLFPDKADGADASGRGKSHSLPPSARYKNDKGAPLQPVSGSHRENGAFVPPGSSRSPHDDDTSKTLKQTKKAGKQNENPPNSSRHPTPATHKIRDHDGPPLRKDSTSQAATNAIKEAKDLKHLADRFKNSGLSESTGMYFQACLKFLYGASLLELCNNEINKHNEIQSMEVYSSTARLCGFCAHEYERSHDMAAAALAYKCMEVAYMRVIYSSHSHATRDRHELQTALQIVPPGESPSSSASDVDNLNNPVTLDKIPTKGVGSPQVAGNNGITARNRSSVMRLLNYAQSVSHAMEAAKKSRIAFAAANSKCGEPYTDDGISSVRRALDFNFQDVDGLLRLVRIAMDAISR